jgi:hypothetical protein
MVNPPAGLKVPRRDVLRRVAASLIVVASMPGGAMLWTGAAHASGEPSPTRSPAMAVKTSSGKGDFDIQQLGALLPATLGGWKQTALGQPLPSPMNEPRPALRAVYQRDGRMAELTLTTSLPIPVAKGSRTINHQRDELRKLSTATLPLSNGIVIVASSTTAERAELTQLIESIDLDRAEALVRGKKKA